MYKQRKKEKGITLIGLIITVVVLLIIAGVSISSLTGNNGIIGKTQNAKIQTEIDELEEATNEIYLRLESNSIKEATMEDIVLKLKEKGYKIEQVVTSGSEITGISIEPNTIAIGKGESAQITVTYERDTTTVAEYYAVMYGKYYKMTMENNKVNIEDTATEVGGATEEKELTAESSDTNYATIDSINENVITVKGGSDLGTATITVKYGTFEETCIVSVVVKPS